MTKTTKARGKSAKKKTKKPNPVWLKSRRQLKREVFK